MPKKRETNSVPVLVENSRGNGETERSKPFVKWAGGKRQLLAEILRHVPERFGTYHEPFLGGGAVFFALPQGTVARLSDSNERLVRAYRGVKFYVEAVITRLKQFKLDKNAYLEQRDRNIDAETDAEMAAWFIYLNKTGFNGLYRVNSKNAFNVPFGVRTGRLNICDEDNLRSCSRALVNATIVHQHFDNALRQAERGDLVYLDPPYIPVSTTSHFTSYTDDGFTNDDQVRLRDAALTLKKKGARVIVSNSSAAKDLYKKGFKITEVLASRQVNSKADRRGKIAELLIT